MSTAMSKSEVSNSFDSIHAFIQMMEEHGRLDESSQNPKSLLKRLYYLQVERVQTYKMFEEGFQAYLNSAPLFNFPLYRQLVNEITQTFLKISEEILTIKKQLSEEYHLEEIASKIDRLQEEEKKKLDLTATLQISRQKNKDHQEDLETEITETKSSISDVMENINEILEDIKYESEDFYFDDAT